LVLLLLPCVLLWMDHPNRLQWLFDRYLAGACSAQEVEELVILLNQEGADHLLTGQMQAVWDRIHTDHPTYPVDWDKMLGEITQSEDLRSLRVPWFKWVAAAAVLFLLMGVGAYWYANRSPVPSRATARADTHTYMPPKTQTLHLPDGSTVVLNVGSKLDYPTAFTGNTREVYLNGEGYFDVHHLPTHPFLVHTGKITTRVLGTTFNIKAYPNEATIEVTVTTGKVQVLKDHKSLGLVTSNQQIRFSKITEDFRENRVNTAPIIAWKPEEIFMDDITMKEAAAIIEHRFGMSVTFKNQSLTSCRVTATFSSGDSLDEFMTVLCGINKTNYTVRDHTIIIDGEGCG